MKIVLKWALLWLGLLIGFGLSTAANAELKGEVVVSIKPLHSLVQSVLGDQAKAVLLIPGSASPHGYMLKPSQLRRLNRARFVIYIDDAMESSLAAALPAIQSEATPVVVSSLPGLTLLPRRQHVVWAEHGDSDHAGDNHESSHDDLHLWLDPHNAIEIVKNLAALFSTADPANETSYRANAAASVSRLTQLDTLLMQQLSAVAEQPFLVFHDAYQYLQQRYGLNGVGTVLFDPHELASIKRLQAVRKAIQHSEVVCAFKEPQFPEELLTTVTEGLGVSIGNLDAMGADLEPGSDLYFEMMTRLGTQFTDCLSQGR